MSLTKAQLISETQNQADAENSSRWNSTTIGRILDTVYRREWSRILGVNPTYRWAERAVTTDSDGRIAVADLSTATQRLHKVLQLEQNLVEIPPLDVNDAPYMGGNANSVATRGYYFLGDYIQVLPMGSGESLTVYVNHIPKAISDLASSDTVVFPTDYEMILAFEGAAFMLSKGSAETQAASEILALAEAMRQDMLADIKRRSTGIAQVGFPDSPGDFAA